MIDWKQLPKIDAHIHLTPRKSYTTLNILFFTQFLNNF